MGDARCVPWVAVRLWHLGHSRGDADLETTLEKPLGLLTAFKKVQPWLVWLSGSSVGCEPKGRQFNSQSGHMPGLLARSPVGGVQEATTHWCFSPSLSLSLPLFKNNNNKIFKKKKKYRKRFSKLYCQPRTFIPLDPCTQDRQADWLKRTQYIQIGLETGVCVCVYLCMCTCERKKSRWLMHVHVVYAAETSMCFFALT